MATMESIHTKVPAANPSPTHSQSTKDPVKTRLNLDEAQAHENGTPDLKHENTGSTTKRRHHFDRATEQGVQAAMSLSYQVVVASRESRPLPEISGAQGAELALLASDLIRILNSDQVTTSSIARAVACMRGEDRITAGQALRQARWLSKIKWRQPRARNGHGNNAEVAAPLPSNGTKPDAPNPAKTNGQVPEDKENVKPQADSFANAKGVDQATSKSKKKNSTKPGSQARNTSVNSNDKNTATGPVEANDAKADKADTSSTQKTEQDASKGSEKNGVALDEVKQQDGNDN